jgi:hypothetical protein
VLERTEPLKIIQFFLPEVLLKAGLVLPKNEVVSVEQYRIEQQRKRLKFYPKPKLVSNFFHIFPQVINNDY